jgi:hypothetical protein
LVASVSIAKGNAASATNPAPAAAQAEGRVLRVHLLRAILDPLLELPLGDGEGAGAGLRIRRPLDLDEADAHVRAGGDLEPAGDGHAVHEHAAQRVQDLEAEERAVPGERHRLVRDEAVLDGDVRQRPGAEHHARDVEVLRRQGLLHELAELALRAGLADLEAGHGG